jgi:hypothetical protein
MLALYDSIGKPFSEKLTARFPPSKVASEPERIQRRKPVSGRRTNELLPALRPQTRREICHLPQVCPPTPVRKPPCNESAFKCFGTAYIFERRAAPLRFGIKLLTFSSSAAPLATRKPLPHEVFATYRTKKTDSLLDIFLFAYSSGHVLSRPSHEAGCII